MCNRCVISYMLCVGCWCVARRVLHWPLACVFLLLGKKSVTRKKVVLHLDFGSLATRA